MTGDKPNFRAKPGERRRERIYWPVSAPSVEVERIDRATIRQPDGSRWLFSRIAFFDP